VVAGGENADLPGDSAESADVDENDDEVANSPKDNDEE
jgi:hypothetical protein